MFSAKAKGKEKSSERGEKLDNDQLEGHLVRYFNWTKLFAPQWYSDWLSQMKKLLTFPLWFTWQAQMLAQIPSAHLFVFA